MRLPHDRGWGRISLRVVEKWAVSPHDYMRKGQKVAEMAVAEMGVRRWGVGEKGVARWSLCGIIGGGGMPKG